MASKKVVLVLALIFILKCHWAQCQFFGNYGGFGFPGGYGYDDDDDWEMILPILLLTLCGRGDYGGGFGGGFGGGYAPLPIPYAGGGGCGCGCGGCGRC